MEDSDLRVRQVEVTAAIGAVSRGRGAAVISRQEMDILGDRTDPAF